MSALVEVSLTMLWALPALWWCTRLVSRRPKPRHIWGELQSSDVMHVHRRKK